MKWWITEAGNCHTISTLLAEELETGAILEDLDQHPETEGTKDVPCAGIALLPGLDDLRTGSTLREG